MARLTTKRVCKFVSRSRFNFAEVIDTRAYRSHRQETLPAILRLLVVAIASGHRKLRDIEALSEDMTPAMRNKLGLKRRVSDTTLWEILERTLVWGFRQQLWQQVRHDLDSKALSNDLFARGVVSYDGKCAAWGTGERPNQWCQKGFYNYGDDASWRLFTLRSCLTSSSARPVLDQQRLTYDGEATAFAEMFQRDVKQFPRLFRYVTTDAGIISEDNAKAVTEAGKHYLFALKKNLRWLYRVAINELQDVKEAAQYKEWYRGKLIIRTLYRVEVPRHVRFPGASQFLCVTSMQIDQKGHKKIHHRFFVTSIPKAELSPHALLKLVRLHWGIENCPNWTMDMMLDEDSHWPCKKGYGVVVLSWLNLLAYNLLSVFRASVPETIEGKIAWWRIQQWIYQILVFREIEVLVWAD